MDKENKEEYHIRRYREDPEFRERIRQRASEYNRRRRECKMLHEMDLQRKRENYRNYTSHRERVKAYYRERYHRLHPEARYNKPKDSQND